MTDEVNVEAAIARADALAEAFEETGERIARSLESAAARGELSFQNLAESIVNDLARIAVGELIEAPLNGLLDSVIGQSEGRKSDSQIAASLNRTLGG